MYYELNIVIRRSTLRTKPYDTEVFIYLFYE